MDGWTNGRMDGWTDGRMDGWMDEDHEDSLAKRYQLSPPGCFKWFNTPCNCKSCKWVLHGFANFSFQVNVYNLLLLAKLEKATHFEWFQYLKFFSLRYHVFPEWTLSLRVAETLVVA